MIKNVHDKLRENLPYTVLRLGLSCNANCLFCNVPPESYSAKEMSTQEAKREICRLVISNRKLRLDISGGEPTIRKDLIELIDYTSKKKVEAIQVQTNAILLSNKTYVRRLKSAGLNKLFIALHSSIPKIQDALLGFKGAFKRCVRGIENALSLGMEVSLNPVINTKNYEHLLKYIKFIRNNFPQIKNITLSVIQPKGRAWKNSYLVPRYNIISPYIAEVVEMSGKSDISIYNPFCGLPLCIGNWYRYLDRCTEYYDNLIKLKEGMKNNHLNNLNKIKSDKCTLCDLTDFCNGVWEEYALLYSFTGLKPIKLKKPIWQI